MIECSSCVQEKRIDALEDDSKRNTGQHREFYEKFSKQEVESAISAERQSAILSSINDIKKDTSETRKEVSELKLKPAKKWDSVSMYALTTVVGAIIGYVMSLIF